MWLCFILHSWWFTTEDINCHIFFISSQIDNWMHIPFHTDCLRCQTLRFPRPFLHSITFYVTYLWNHDLAKCTVSSTTKLLRSSSTILPSFQFNVSVIFIVSLCLSLWGFFICHILTTISLNPSAALVLTLCHLPTHIIRFIYPIDSSDSSYSMDDIALRSQWDIWTKLCHMFTFLDIIFSLKIGSSLIVQLTSITPKILSASIYTERDIFHLEYSISEMATHCRLNPHWNRLFNFSTSSFWEQLWCFLDI